MEEAGGKVGRRWQIAIAGGTRNGKVAGANGWHRRQRCMEVAGGKVGGRWQIPIAKGEPEMERWQARTSGIEGNVAWRWQVARSEGGGK